MIRSALTLVELLLVIGLIALVSVPSFLAFSAFRQKQALAASTEMLTMVMTRARIYSRESKGGRTWGVRQIDSSSYRLLSSKNGVETVEAEYGLDRGVRFDTGTFTIWFDQVTGETANEVKVYLYSNAVDRTEIKVSKGGLIEHKKI